MFERAFVVSSCFVSRYLHHCSFRSEKNQRIGDKLISLMKKVCCQLSHFSHTQVRGDSYMILVRAKNESKVAKWKTKESGFSLKDKKSKFSLKSEPRSRSTPILIKKKYPGIEWNYWVSAEGNWSYYCRWWTTPTRSTTSSRTTIRTKSRTSWSSYQKSLWDGRIEERSRVTNRSSRWIFEKKIHRKSGHY